jgi:aldehyde:ferredoxin oxidoreductase
MEIRFGDADAIVDLVEKIARRQGVGDLLAEGSRQMAARLGQGSERFAMHVKGLELPAYDPRAAKITGLGYVTANRGGDHMTGYIQGPAFVDVPFLIVEDSAIRDPFVADPRRSKGPGRSGGCAHRHGLHRGCKFMAMGLTAEELTRSAGGRHRLGLGRGGFRRGDVYNLARLYCVGSDRRQHDVLPARLMEELPERPSGGHGYRPNGDDGRLSDAYFASGAGTRRQESHCRQASPARSRGVRGGLLAESTREDCRALWKPDVLCRSPGSELSARSI